MAQGVHARCRGQHRWEAPGQLRIADRQVRQQVGAQGDGLAACLGKLDQGAPSRLAAGSRRRGNGDHGRKIRRDPIQPPLGQVIIRQPPGMRDEQSDRLGGVDRTPSTQADQAVTLGVPISVEARQNVRLGGIRLHVLKENRRRDRCDHVPNQTGSHEAGIGHDKWPADSQPAQLG